MLQRRDPHWRNAAGSVTVGISPRSICGKRRAEVGPAIWLRQPIAFHGLMPSACTTSRRPFTGANLRTYPQSLRNQKSAARLVSYAAREPHGPGVHIMKKSLLITVGCGLFASVALAQTPPRAPGRHRHRIS